MTATPPTGSLSPTVLVADDDAEVRLELHALLEQEGIAVVGQAADGAETIRAALELAPDVILMDLKMPGVDGLEATERIKEHLPLTQIIFLTVYEDTLLTTSAEEAGAYAYLVKGCSPELICTVIRHAAELKAGLEARDRTLAIRVPDQP
jgi:DNA-binding NarL/FixJ family response regulator